MAKLYFRYGAMGAAKTLNLLAVAHNYRRQGKEVCLIKPCVDTRDGAVIRSRTGLCEVSDMAVGIDANLKDLVLGSLKLNHDLSCLLVDEAQFLEPTQVDQLRALTVDPGIPVICYGLRADFRSQLFPGSQRLLELADSIEEIKTTCQYCERKATQNLRLVASEEQVLVGGDDLYAPACWACFQERSRACI